MITDYKIAEGESAMGLEVLVQKLIKEGYQPQGQLRISPGSAARYYTLFQVMVKDDGFASWGGDGH